MLIPNHRFNLRSTAFYCSLDRILVKKRFVACSVVYIRVTVNLNKCLQIKKLKVINYGFEKLNR